MSICFLACHGERFWITGQLVMLSGSIAFVGLRG